jgi:hypothetical protein
MQRQSNANLERRITSAPFWEFLLGEGIDETELVAQRDLVVAIKGSPSPLFFLFAQSSQDLRFATVPPAQRFLRGSADSKHRSSFLRLSASD